MFKEHQTASPFDNDDWAERSEFWAVEAIKAQVKKSVRQRNPNPLILTGHGTSLRIEQGSLSIKQGFTHYPQKAETFRFFNGDLNLPRLIMLLDGSGSLSFDVLSWLAEQNVALARVKSSGEVAVIASPTGYIADRAKVFWQIETGQCSIERLRYSIALIKTKLANCIRTLEIAFPQSPNRQKIIAKLANAVAGLATSPPMDLKQLRGIEATCASSYFGIWAGYALKWKANPKTPIPPSWLQYAGRPSQANGLKAKNVNASHPINAMLNYAYAVKQAQLQITAIADGFDPTIGIMHNGRRGLPAYIFDQIEPQRPLVDRAILAFMENHTFCAADFILRKDGVCRLSPQLAKRVAALVID